MAEKTAAERVALARHPQRPNITDYIDGLFTDFFEQRGDRACREDPAILGGIALFHGRPVTVIGTRKGKTLEENLRCNFGMPGPEGYRKALRLMKQAEKFRRPVFTFIDTAGAYPGPEGFASILWKDAQRSGEAAELMKLTAPELKKLGVIDGIVREPEGGAQTDPSRTLWNLDRALTACLEPLLKESVVSLTERRYQKFRALGRGKEDA